MSQEHSNSSSVAVDSPVRVIDFFTLPRPVQDRVVASLAGQGAPSVLAYRPNSRWRVVRWAWAALLTFVGLVAIGALGFGDLGGAYALHGQVFLAAYVGLGVLCGLALAAYFVAGRRGEYPFALGTYLLPVGVVEVTRRRLVVTSVVGLRRVVAVGGSGLRLEFATRVFEFPMPVGTTLESLRLELEAYREQWANAFQAGDRKTLAGLDPIRDSGFSNPLSSRAAIARVRTRVAPRLVLGILIGASVGGLVFWGRNGLAERSIYRKAVALNTEAAYRAYLANGGKRQDVVELRLPQAELIAANGNLEGIEKYAAAHPDSKIQGDIDKLLRLELLRELHRVRTSSDLAALESFKTAHPQHELVAQELAAVRHDVFRTAFDTFKKKHTPSREAAQFLDALAVYAERNGPLVDLRIRRELPSSMDRADSAIRRSSYFTGQKAIPSQYFKGDLARAREEQVLAALVDALQSGFPRSVLRFVSNPGEEGVGPEPVVQRPTLFVSYKTEMSGGYTTNRPRGVYVGLGMMFQVAGLVPGVTEPFRFKDSSWLPPDINQISKNLLRPEQVYEANANEGFERFSNRLLGRIFGEKGAPQVRLAKSDGSQAAPEATNEDRQNTENSNE